jgi:uncharacterized protein YndB with AHSA1/START domain
VTKYFEVEPNALLVYDHGGSRDRPPLFRVRVEFKETDGKTEMKMAMILPTPEAAEDTKKFIKQANGYSTWDRLAEYLAKQTSGKDPFVINRSFEVSRDVMFEMWTNPKHFSQWIAPSGFTTEFFKADIRSGASSFYMMTNGVYTMYGRAHYIEVRKPDQLVYTQQFCDDKNEKTSRHPLAPTWPETMKTVVTFTEEGPRTTRVTIEWEVYGEATSDERKTFHDGKTGMNQGWSGSFDKLEDYLSNR